MSKLVRIARTSQELSLAAMEEASRQGRRKADLEHLFIALVLTDQPAGRILRGLGITLDDARRAVQDQHEALLASVGVYTDLPAPGRIVFHETGGFDWSQRAIDLIGRAGGKRRDGSAAAVLRELMAEPSGLIADLLTYLGTTPDTIIEALDRDPSVTRVGRTSRPKVKGRVSGSSESFVPAPVEEVWEFLADPARICDWEPGIGSIELGADHDTRDVHLGMTWETRAMTERPDGKPMKVKEAFRRRVVELVMAQYPHRVSWRFSYPDSERGKPVLMEFRLYQTAGGTRVNMTVSWPRREGWRWLAGAPLRPARVFLTWLHLFQIGAAISRAFR